MEIFDDIDMKIARGKTKRFTLAPIIQARFKARSLRTKLYDFFSNPIFPRNNYKKSPGVYSLKV